VTGDGGKIPECDRGWGKLSECDIPSEVQEMEWEC
jgi:hypothetical protein